MDILFVGQINGIRYTDTSVIVTASEKKSGYKKKDGTIVNDEIHTYKFVFKPYFKTYIANHFSERMLVKIKGFLLPYEKDINGNNVNGFTIIGQTIDMASYQSSRAMDEIKIIKESQSHDNETPNLREYQEADF